MNSPQQHIVDVEVLVEGLHAAGTLLAQFPDEFVDVQWLAGPHFVLRKAEIGKKKIIKKNQNISKLTRLPQLFQCVRSRPSNARAHVDMDSGSAAVEAQPNG